MIADTILLERFEREDGLDTFDEEESLVLLLELARCRGNCTYIARQLLNEFGSLKGVLEAREEQLKKIEGVGRRSIALIRMVLPFTRVWERAALANRERIGNIYEAEHYCKSLLMGLRNERFYVISLNATCRVLGEKKISEGSLSECSAYPRMVLEAAINHNAHSVILCHNHPGGTNAPSAEDIASTIQLQRVLNSVGIMLLDHIIVSGANTYSMVQHGDITYKVKG